MVVLSTLPRTSPSMSATRTRRVEHQAGWRPWWYSASYHALPSACELPEPGEVNTRGRWRPYWYSASYHALPSACQLPEPGEASRTVMVMSTLSRTSTSMSGTKTRRGEYQAGWRPWWYSQHLIKHSPACQIPEPGEVSTREVGTTLVLSAPYQTFTSMPDTKTRRGEYNKAWSCILVLSTLHHTHEPACLTPKPGQVSTRKGGAISHIHQHVSYQNQEKCYKKL
jgi:hypothetical protein